MYLFITLYETSALDRSLKICFKVRLSISLDLSSPSETEAVDHVAGVCINDQRNLLSLVIVPHEPYWNME